MEFVKPTRAGVMQIVSQETGRSLQDITDQTPLEGLTLPGARERILKVCDSRFWIVVTGPEDMIVEDLLRLLRVR